MTKSGHNSGISNSKIKNLDANINQYKEKSKLKELGDIFSGHYLRPEKLKSSGKFLYLTPRHIQNKELVLSEKDKFIDNGEQYSKYMLMPGDIIISSLWKTRKIYQYKSTDTPSIIGTNWIVLRTEINDYLSKYLEIKEFYKKFVWDCDVRLRGSLIPFLSCRDLKEIEIFLLPEDELLNKYKEEKLSKIQELELLSSIDKSTLENTQKEFIYELIKEHFADPIVKLSKQSESSHLEFKTSFRRDVEKGGKVPEMELIHSVLKTIGGFCNTGGGDLLIGVTDDNKIVGIEVDEFDNQDKFLLALTQHIENKTTPDVMNLPDVIDITFYKSEDKTICRVNVNPTPENVYVKYKNDDIFYKRKGPKTVSLRDRDLVKYIEQKNSMYE